VGEEQPLQRIGDYEVLGVLGAGGMGKVYKVRNTITDRVEALKVVLPDLAGQKEVAERFLREIKLLASLNHPNIASLHTALTVGNQLVMVMEFVEGVPLSALLKEGPIPPAQAVQYIDQVLVALSYAHGQHIIHRDIKPANMMLTPQGRVKLMDFGIARSSEDHGLTATGSSLGSLPYMSPEQITGSSLDARADLYSVGVSLYEMVTGRRPFEADSQYSIMAAHLQKAPTPPIEIHAGLPATLNQIILMALAKDPNARFQSADAFRNALKTVAEGLKDASDRVSEAPPPIPGGATALLQGGGAVASVTAGPVVSSVPPPVAPPGPAGAASVSQDSPTRSAVVAVPVAAPPMQLAGQAFVRSAEAPAAQPSALSTPGVASRPASPPAAAAASSAREAAVANPSRSSPMPVTTKQGGYRGLYMTLGALVVVAVLVAAGLYLPRWARARASGGTSGNSRPSSQPAASGTPSSPASTAETPSAVPVTPAPAAASDSAGPAGGSPAGHPQAPNPPSAAGSSLGPTTSGAPSSRPLKKASHAGRADQRAGSANASGAEPSFQTPADSQSSSPQAAGNGDLQSEAANAAEIEDLESQMDPLSARARAVKDSVENFRRQQEKQGLNLRGDISAAEDRMATYMDKAQTALQSKNAKDARRYMEKAEADVETLERFLGRR